MDGPQPEARAILLKGKKGRGSAIQEGLVECFFFFIMHFLFLSSSIKMVMIVKQVMFGLE